MSREREALLRCRTGGMRTIVSAVENGMVAEKASQPVGRDEKRSGGGSD